VERLFTRTEPLQVSDLASEAPREADTRTADDTSPSDDDRSTDDEFPDDTILQLLRRQVRSLKQELASLATYDDVARTS